MKAIFKTHPNLTEAYFTSDDQAFYSEDAARNHAKTLTDKDVELVKNTCKEGKCKDVDETEEHQIVKEQKEAQKEADALAKADANAVKEASVKAKAPAKSKAAKAKKVVEEKSTEEEKS